MKWLALLLLLLFALLQYRLWLAEGSKTELLRLQEEIQRQQQRNEQLSQRNHDLELEVIELQKGPSSLEERAREDLGMIKEGETYYQIIEQEAQGQQ
ncbi:MAG: cell division protein FtsB [Halieaceae bacterium]|nr:cell division protein FtsB [Halieaceae bacterium]